MPQIPNTFVPNTALTSAPSSAFGASSVDPMRNAAPQQMEQMGDAASKVGETIDSIGARVQWQLDDAATKSAVTSFMQQAQQVLSGDGSADNPGYMNTRGQAAVDGFAPATAALAQIKQQGLDGLSNNFQKMMYNRVTTAHLTNYGATMADHHFQQNAIYSAQAASDESNAYLQSAVGASKSIGQTDVDGNPTGDFYAYRDQAVQAKQHSLFIATGANPDSPQGVEAAKQVTTAIAQGVIAHMLDNHDYQGAQSFYSSELEQGHLDERTAEMLGAAIKRNTDVETVKDVSNQLISSALRAAAGQPVGINPQLPIKGGSYTMNKNDDGSQTFIIPQGTAVNAAADGKITSITQDKPGEPYTVEMTHVDGSTTQYGNLSAVNYKVGDAVMQGQQPIGLTAKGGLDYSMADKDGKAVDPSSQVLPPVDLTKFADPRMAQSVIDQINNTDYPPEMKAQMATYVDSQQKVNFRQDAENKQMVIQPLQDAFYQYADAHKSMDGSPTYSANALTPSQWATMDSINPELADRLRSMPATQARQRLSQYREDIEYSPRAIDLEAGFAADPSTLTVAAVQANRAYLPPNRYVALLGRAQELQTAGPKGVEDATAINERIKYFASNNGVNVEPKTTEDKQTWINLQGRVQQSIDQIKEQNHGKATAEQVDKAIQQQLIQHTLTTPRSPWNPLAITGISPSSTTQVRTFQIDPAQSKNAPPTYQYNAVNPVTGHMIGSQDGKTWVDAQTGKAVQ